MRSRAAHTSDRVASCRPPFPALPRSTALLLGALVAAASAQASTPPARPPLSFDERVAYQAAIEQVYHRHRIWPKENPGPKPALEELMPPPILRAKVEDYLRKSNALEVHWRRPVTAEQLQAEMDRMARDTKDPAMLAELFAALDDDPHVIAECLARPSLVDRLVHGWFARDGRLHADVRAAAERELLRMRTTEDMRAANGTYREVEYASDAPGPTSVDEGAAGAVRLPADRWEGWIRGLRVEPGGVKILQEDDERFFVNAVITRDAERLRIASVAWNKVPFDAWWARSRTTLPTDIAEPSTTDYAAPSARSVGSCARDTWTPTPSAPGARYGHTAVWTGSEMIVWGGALGQYSATGARYRPALDTWLPTGVAANVPSARDGHAAVWTGTEMIVWGGLGSTGLVNSGARYSPLVDAWVPTSTGGSVPAARRAHTAAWTGREMIVWGGSDLSGNLDTGGRYDPASDSWQPVDTGPNHPVPRTGHTAVWTGTQMIVWGGTDLGRPLSSGGRYDPNLDSWLATATGNGASAPRPRYVHTAVWTGSEMIVWGGVGAMGPLDSGGRYDPATDSWASTSTASNLPAPRYLHGAVWTGAEMIVWGGGSSGTGLDSGGRYDPVSDSWAPMTGASTPTGRAAHTTVWTGTEMIVWGGVDLQNSAPLGTGGRYDPITDSWVATGTGAAPTPREAHTAVWTGSEMIVWGGYDTRGVIQTGGRYDLATDSWVTMSTGSSAPSPRAWHAAVWTGREMVVWGGSDGGAFLDTGSRYEPSTDSWTPLRSGNGEPAARRSHTAVWTGTEMIVWGGRVWGSAFDSGGRYDPTSDSWAGTSTGPNTPSARYGHAAIWTGTEMIVWGGMDASLVQTGGRYLPATDSWTSTSTSTGVPVRRSWHTAVWTGREMIVWGGVGPAGSVATGGLYDPSTDSWMPTGTGANVPGSRAFHTAVWTGSEMVVWGGSLPVGYANTGGRYDPSTSSWSATSTGAYVPAARHGHTASWTGRVMILWGGSDGGPLDTGASYCPDDTRLVGHVVGQGHAPTNPPEVKVYSAAGALLADFYAYGTGGGGVNVAGADVELGPYAGVLTGPGPVIGFGPHVRAFRRDGTPIAKVSFYAYGTLRHGVNVASASTDADAYDEMLSGAGPGAVFGPHVRGFDYDATAVTPIAKINFFAYGTLRYGVNVASGDVDADGFGEILTGAGPSPAFAPTVRGFDVDGGTVTALAKINFDAFPYPGYGANVAGGDVDADAYNEIVATPGPGTTHPSRFLGVDYDAAGVQPLPGFDIIPFMTLYGGRVGAGDVSNDGREDLLCGAGRDPAADATVLAFAYTGTLTPVPGTFTPFPSLYGVNVAASETGY